MSNRNTFMLYLDLGGDDFTQNDDQARLTKVADILQRQLLPLLTSEDTRYPADSGSLRMSGDIVGQWGLIS